MGRRSLGAAWPLFAAQQPQWMASLFNEVLLALLHSTDATDA